MALRGISCHRVLAPLWPVCCGRASAVAVPMYSSGSSYAPDLVCCYLLVAAAVRGATVVCAAVVVCAAAVPCVLPLCRL